MKNILISMSIPKPPFNRKYMEIRHTRLHFTYMGVMFISFGG